MMHISTTYGFYASKWNSRKRARNLGLAPQALKCSKFPNGVPEKRK
jgi:hypothetical protein